MTDLTALENKIMAEIRSAEDTRSLEEVRVSALGKKGGDSRFENIRRLVR